MNIDNLTLGQIKQLRELFGENQKSKETLNCQLGEKVIIRTYSAGVWFGTLDQKSGNEVILKDARRMWKWWARKSISLSGVAQYGIRHDESKIAPAVSKVWLEAIEIISLTNEAIESIESTDDAEAE